VDLSPELAADRLTLNGRLASERDRLKGSALMELVRSLAWTRLGQRLGYAHITSVNTFPTGAGLASSASGFAALALAASHAAGLDLSPSELSALARRGSGSAARSIFGGLVEMHPGSLPTGEDAHAAPLDHAADWPLRMVVAVVSEEAKATSSTDGMDLTTRTSAYFPAWTQEVGRDLQQAREAIARRDLQHLGEVTEASCLKMHASAFAARPGVVYLRGPTLEALHALRALRQSGVGAWFTADAGPQAKALCHQHDVEAVVATLAAVPGVVRTLVCGPGEGARVLDARVSQRARWPAELHP
jgi:diphosphomevalonate decarboxylase